MNVHGVTFVFFTSLSFLVGTVSGWWIREDDWENPLIVAAVLAAIVFLLTLGILVARGIVHV